MTDQEVQSELVIPRWFRPLTGEPKRRTIIAFDIEGSGVEDGFVCGAICGEYVSQFYLSREAMWHDLLCYGAEGALLYAHNLEYDLPITAGNDLWSGKLLFKSSGMLWADFHHWKKRVRFMDSTNLFPAWSVAKIGKELGMPKLKVSKSIIQRLGNGAKWKHFTKREQKLIEKYCMQDAKIVYEGVSILQEEALSLGGQLQATLAGIAMDVFRRTYHKWPWKVLPQKVNMYLRPSYYGGRVENFVFGKVKNVNLYDINSLYPHILATANFPHPNHIRMVEEDSARRYLDTWEGIACATVEVSNTYCPTLPHRVEQKLFFPTGTFTGQWTISELRYALHHDTKLIDLHWIVGTDVLFNPFNDFVESLYKHRKEYINANNDRHIIIKTIMSSLYGRFGLNPDKGLFQMIPAPPDVGFADYQGWTTEEVNGRVVLIGPFDFKSYPAYANVMFAGLVSSEARAALHTGLLKSGTHSLYCDTDSILCTNQMKTGNELGEWKRQMHKGKADLLGPKEYVLYHSSKPPTYKVKGVPSKAKPAFIKTGIARYTRAIKIREAIRQKRNPAEWVQVVKEHHRTLPKRRPVRPPSEWKKGYCQTVPWYLPDLVQMIAEPKQELLQHQDDQSLKYLREWVIPVYVNPS